MCAEQFGADVAVRGAAGEGAAQFEARTGGRQGGIEVRGVGEHPGGAVEAALVALADIVEEGGGDEVGVGVSAIEEPGGGTGGVDDVARVLGGEKVEQWRGQVPAGDGEVGGRGGRTGAGELGEAAEDHTRSRKTVL